MGNNIFCLNFCLNVFFFKLDYVIFNLIFILELQKLSQIEKYHSLWNILLLELRYNGNDIFCLNFCLNVFFFKLDYVIFNLIFILELQKLSQIEKYHSVMKYIAFRAQIWGIISFASTFASMYFSSS